MAACDATALLVVDAQNDIMAGTALREKTIANIADCVGRARAAGIPVVWVQHTDEGMPEASGGWQIVEGLSPAPGEPIVHKAYGDSFAETELQNLFERAGVTHFFLCGAMTDACIRSTLFGGLYRGYGVTLVADAHTTADRDGAPFTALQAIGLVNMMAEYSTLPGMRSQTTTAAEFPG